MLCVFCVVGFVLNVTEVDVAGKDDPEEFGKMLNVDDTEVWRIVGDTEEVCVSGKIVKAVA